MQASASFRSLPAAERGPDCVINPICCCGSTRSRDLHGRTCSCPPARLAPTPCSADTNVTPVQNKLYSRSFKQSSYLQSVWTGPFTLTDPTVSKNHCFSLHLKVPVYHDRHQDIADSISWSHTLPTSQDQMGSTGTRMEAQNVPGQVSEPVYLTAQQLQDSLCVIPACKYNSAA